MTITAIRWKSLLPNGAGAECDWFSARRGEEDWIVSEACLNKIVNWNMTELQPSSPTLSFHSWWLPSYPSFKFTLLMPLPMPTLIWQLDT